MPRRKKAEVKGTPRESPRRSNRPAKADNGVPRVYQEMLVEERIASEACTNRRASKRRRVEVPPPDLDGDVGDTAEVPAASRSVSPTRPQQVVFDDQSESDVSDDEFEDVDLDAKPEAGPSTEQSVEPLQINLSTPLVPTQTTPRRRKAVNSKADRQYRLNLHKWHVLCLIFHGHWRSRWCDNVEVQQILKTLVPRKTIDLLHLNESKPQYARNHAFMESIKEISEIWKQEWQITEQGLRRPFWPEESDAGKVAANKGEQINLEEFIEAAQTRAGSRDLGAQLFCALMRSLGVETRLAFSLQPLPFSGVAKGPTPEKPQPQYIFATQAIGGEGRRRSASPASAPSPSNVHWRMSDYASTEIPPPPGQAQSIPKKRIKDSPFPIFWVEAFNSSIDKWLPIDPLVRHTINKPRTGFEPPLSDPLNQMSYVLAFEDDGSVRDVTRRYASTYNAKTRKLRVESTGTENELWWRRSLRFFRRPFKEAKDQIEDDELNARDAQEGMPKAIADFKGHHVYALERHLRRNEVVWPRREAGKVNVGTAKDGIVEPVFRRRDVQLCRSSDQWYRRGRDVKAGEQPLKRVVPRRRRDDSLPSEPDDDETAGTGLYAEFQTEIYVPPEAVDGRIPRNAYDNLDIYVPSMIPAGAIHVRHPLAAQASKTLGLDYADAVTGFDFKGRHGTAVVNGVVVAAEAREAVVEVIEAMQIERVMQESERRSAAALQLWRRFVTALRIRERVEVDYAREEDEDGVPVEGEEGAEYDDDGDDAGGGFMPNADVAHDTSQAEAGPLYDTALPGPDLPAITPVVVVESPRTKPSVSEQSFQSGSNTNGLQHHDSLFDEAEQAGGFIADGNGGEQGGGFIAAEDEKGELGGGFMVEDDAAAAGGYIAASETSPGHNEEADVDSPPMQQSSATPSEAAGEHSTQEAPGRHSVQETQESQMGGISSPPMAHEAPQAPAHDAGAANAPLKPRPALKTSHSLSSTSLLSHDPEDEDAEPDWLVEDE